MSDWGKREFSGDTGGQSIVEMNGRGALVLIVMEEVEEGG